MSKVRIFLDRVEELVVKSIEKAQENIEKVEEKLEDEFEIINNRIEELENKEPLSMFQNCLKRRYRIEQIKEQSKGRRHNSRKQCKRR